MRAALLVLGLWLLFLVTGVGQQASADHEKISTALHAMESESWTDRSKAYQESAAFLASGKEASEDADRLRVGLIKLLATENVQTRILAKQDASEDETEEYSQYYASLVGAVADLKDERAIPSLLGAAYSGGMATQGVARFGKTALNPVLEQVTSRDANLASGAVWVIREMLAMHTVADPDSRLRMENALKVALSSPNFGVRDSALYAIEYLDNREEFVPMLNDIAEHDPFKRSDGGGDSGDIYPVRHHARSLLRKIAEHEPPATDKGVRQ
jgi:HEAT repeat protein